MLAAEFLGRPLLAGEIVHHRDGDSTNNTRENLLVLPSQAYHAHIEAVLRRERGGQPYLFPELLRGVRREASGTLFDNVLL
ncbi:HNH endonuclease [Deinococcus wulumuqiensis]